MHTETSQLTEDNEDFAGRGRYHQSEIVQGKHFDDDFQNEWHAVVGFSADIFFLLYAKYRHVCYQSGMSTAVVEHYQVER